MITAEIFCLKQRKEKPMNNDLISRAALLEAIRTDVAPFTLSMVFRHIHSAPAVDAVEVVRCKDCVSHGNCLTEDTFRIARIDSPYCCGGKRRENNG